MGRRGRGTGGREAIGEAVGGSPDKRWLIVCEVGGGGGGRAEDVTLGEQLRLFIGI